MFSDWQLVQASTQVGSLKQTLAQLKINPDTVRLGKMAQHERLWAPFMTKLKGQSQNASNMALGQYIGLQHIQKSAS